MTQSGDVASLVERIAHKEQIGIWADEIITAISAGDFLKEDWTFDDTVDIGVEVVAQLRSILGSAFCHPEYDVASTLSSLQEENARLREERDVVLERSDQFKNNGKSQRFDEAVDAANGFSREYIIAQEDVLDTVRAWCSVYRARAERAEAQLTAAMEALATIRDLNMSGVDANGHRWANSDMIEQEIVAALQPIPEEVGK